MIDTPNVQIAYPQLIPGWYSGGSWRVDECPPMLACTDPAGRVLKVPQPRLLEDVQVRLHELFHVQRDNNAPDKGRWKGDPHTVAFRKMCEELAVEATALARGVEIRQARDHFDWRSIPLAQLDYQLAQQWLQVAFSCDLLGHPQGGTRNDLIRNYWRATHEALPVAGQNLLWACYRSLSADPSWHNCDTWASRLAQHFPPPAPPTVPTQESEEAKKRRREAEQQEQQAQRAKRGKIADEVQKGESSLAHTALGTVSVHDHTKGSAPSLVVAKQWASRDIGTYVRYPERLYPHGRVFGHRQRTAALLIDASGSMAWDHASLEHLIKSIPGLWAAVYTEHGYVPGATVRPTARLCVIGAKGRLAPSRVVSRITVDEREHTDTNYDSGADAASLAWAVAHAPKPLLWLSDGEVGPGHELEVDRLLARHKVLRAENLHDTIALLQGRTAPTHRTCRSDRPRMKRLGDW